MMLYLYDVASLEQMQSSREHNVANSKRSIGEFE